MTGPFPEAQEVPLPAKVASDKETHRHKLSWHSTPPPRASSISKLKSVFLFKEKIRALGKELDSSNLVGTSKKMMKHRATSATGQHLLQEFKVTACS